MTGTLRRLHSYRGKLSLGDAIRIRARHSAGESARKLAAEYGVAPASVHAVLRAEAHTCMVPVTLADRIYGKLVEVATIAGRRVEELAAEMIAEAVLNAPGRHDD